MTFYNNWKGVTKQSNRETSNNGVTRNRVMEKKIQYVKKNGKIYIKTTQKYKEKKQNKARLG